MSTLRPRGRGHDPARISFLLSAASALCFSLSFTLNVVYLATRVGLDPLQLVLVGTVLEVTCVVLEVPTGLVADLHSRRLSILIGLVLIGLGLTLQGAVPTFAAALTAQVVWGAGSTFTSGATDAWIADEVGADRLATVLVRNRQYALGGSVVGMVGAGALALIDVQVPLVTSGLGFLLLAAVLWRIMPEHGFVPLPRDQRSTFQHLAATARAGLGLARSRRVVRTLLLVSLFVGLSSEAFDRLWQLRLLQGFTVPGVFGGEPYVWFAALELAGVLIALACSLLAARGAAARLDAAHPYRLLAVLAAVQVMGIVGLALAGWLWLAVAALWAKAAAAALAEPLSAAWLNRNLEPGVRATVLSFASQVGALGQVAGGPPLGVLARRTSVPVALLGSAALLAPTAAMLARLRPGPAAGPSRAPVPDPGLG